MLFIPEELTDAVPSEVEVWANVQEAFREAEGMAYHRFPIYRPDGLYGYEADVVLVFPDAGIYVIECKGCRIGNIDRIEGHDWHMQDWTREIERPVRQARDQMFALKDWVTASSEVPDTLPFYHVVALPFIERRAWTKANLDSSPLEGAILLADDLTPDTLRDWVNDRASTLSLSFTDEQWMTVESRLGHIPDATSDQGSVQVYLYRERVPGREDLLDLIPDDASCTYVTATSSIEARRYREGFGGSHQIENNGEGRPEPHFTFPRMMRRIMGVNLFTRAEERVLLWRAAQGVADGDEEKDRRLRHDVFAWRDAIKWVEERGYDLLAGTAPQDVIDDIVHPEVEATLRDFQAEYRAVQHDKAPAKRVFEVAARDFLTEGFRPTDVVVMEGFSRFTPLQRKFIDRCQELGATVIMLFPYRGPQDEAFRAVLEAARPYVVRENGGIVNVRWLATETFPSGSALAHAQKHLFSETSDSVSPDDEDCPGDGSVTVEAYDHMNEEVSSVVDRAIHYVDEEGVDPNDIAIVAPAPGEYVPLILEEAERSGRADLFQVPPRKLLLTPPGRFVLTLYKVWAGDEGRLDMSPDQFMTLMASGWLKASVQKTTRAFEMVKAQFFEGCQTRKQWNDNLDELDRQRRELPESSRLPARSVSAETIHRWRDAIGQIEEICRVLFDGRDRPIGKHVERLVNELTKISERELRRSERKILRAIQTELKNLYDAESIDIETKEFGEILNSLVRQREDEMEDQEEVPDQISVRSPSGIDRASKRVIFMVGMCEDAMPGSPPDQWPIYRFDRDGHYDQQRYLFLATARAAEEALHVSYPKVQEARKNQPSPFVRELVGILNTSLDTKVSICGGTENVGSPSVRSLGPAHRDDDDPYGVDELAHYLLCPHRYMMERLSAESRRYEPMWQIRFLAQGYWIREVMSSFASASGEIDAEDVVEYLIATMVDVEDDVKEAFPGLRRIDWNSVAYHVRKMLEGRATDDGDGTRGGFGWVTRPSSMHDLSQGLPEERTLTATVTGRWIDVHASVHFTLKHGAYHSPRTEDLLPREWLIPGPVPDRDDSNSVWVEIQRSKPSGRTIEIHTTEKDGVGVFATKYDAVQWWSWVQEATYYALTTDKDTNDFTAAWHRDFERIYGDGDAQKGLIAEVIEDLENGHFPKNPGDHCATCSLKSECLGKEP